MKVVMLPLWKPQLRRFFQVLLPRPEEGLAEWSFPRLSTGMSKKQDDPSRPKSDRATRLAEELRANLARRKAQARSRSAGKQVAQDPESPTLEGNRPRSRET
jgi:hypothetical protein